MSEGTRKNWKVVQITAIVPFESAAKARGTLQSIVSSYGSVVAATAEVRELTPAEWDNFNAEVYDGE